MPISDVLYRAYTRRLRKALAGQPMPGHVGLIIDGNRRWARQVARVAVSEGHRFGAEHIFDLMSWCEAAGIGHVTVFVCSAENLARRDNEEVANLMAIIEQTVATRLAERPRWRVHLAGLLDLLPDSTSLALKQAEAATSACDAGRHVTLCVGYGGRQEIVEAVRELLTEQAAAGLGLAAVAASVQQEDIARHLATAGQPDCDLIIRTSGEQRMSNFLLWQATGADLHFCDCYWPAFREIDFLRALRDYAARTTRAH
jgi:short-chain Z-isoprenyl diphosphate synthase